GLASTPKQTTEDELSKYFAQKPVSAVLLKKENTGIDGALGWWKIHESEYPCLAKMAKDYLGILGSGVAVEHFCTGDDLISQRRKGFASGTITACMCLKNWNQKKYKSIKHDILRQCVRYKVLGIDCFEEDDE
ncbi:unnamed protein product, partial [Allacma fusca]